LKPKVCLEALELPDPDRFGAVALSGGTDSVALLGLMQQKFGSHKVIALHVDHACRDEASRQQECSHVEHVCTQLGVELRRHTLKPSELKNEESLRTERYLALSQMAKRNSCEWVALGHHRDDQLETIFMNLLRGTDLKGLCGMPAFFERHQQIYLRPLLKFSREDLERVVLAAQLTAFEDPSNQTDRYHRNRVRSGLLPLCRELAPGYEERVLQLSESIQDWVSWSQEECEQRLKSFTWTTPEEGPCSFPREPLQALPWPLLNLWCHQTLVERTGGAKAITRQHVRELATFIKSDQLGPHPHPFPKNLRFRARKRELLIL
jgi:tRNA(Ile)-lysidine synthase